MAQNPTINSIILESGIQSLIINYSSVYPSSICELPNTKFIVTSRNNIYEFDLYDKSISLYDNNYGVNGHSGSILSCCLLGNNKFLITGSEDRTIRGWNIKTGNCEYVLKGHTYEVILIVPFKKGQIISSDTLTIKIWDVASKQCLKTLQAPNIESLCVTKNYIIYGDSNERVIILDNKTFEQRGIFASSGNIMSIIQLDESHIICGSDNKLITIWNIDTLEFEYELNGHTGIITDLSLLQDGRLVSGSDDKTIRIWNLDTYECENILENNPSLPVNKIKVLDNGWIASYYPNIIRFWNPEEFPKPPEPTFNEHEESLDKDGSILPNCAICWGIINANIPFEKLDCGGIFHYKCIKNIEYCPICNQLVLLQD